MVFEERCLIVPGLFSRVPVACEFVAEAARRAGMDERAVYHCQLAVDECCTNIIEHGFEHEDADQAIDIRCRLEGSRFSITIADEGVPFDPLQKADPDPAAGLEDRQPGGWGIYFIKKVMDQVFYRREGNRNVLMLIKNVDSYPGTDDERRDAARVSITSPRANVWSIAPHDRLDADVLPGMEAFVQERLDAGTLLIVDLSDVDYVSSTGLKTLMSLWQRAQQTDADLVLAGVNGRVREVLEITGLDRVFRVYDTASQAAGEPDS